jgi:YD repeat-containing protein
MTRCIPQKFVWPITLVVLTLCALAPFPANAQQGGLTRYVYDANGRLHAVIAPSGEANIYEYDAVGNITTIRRNMATTLEVLDFSPREGVPGTQVTIVGTGFGASVNAVSFNGVPAQIVSTNAPQVVVTVPSGAMTGPISLTTPGGTATTSIPFTVRGIGVTPAAVTLLSDQTVEFAAMVVGAGSPNVIWSVAGLDGGSSTVGTISAAGFYTAPKLLLGQPFVVFRVRATSASDPSVSGEAVVTVKNPEFLLPAFAGAVSIQNGAPAGSNTFSANVASRAVSIRNSLPPADANTFAANVNGAAVSIQNSLPPSVSSTFTANVNGAAVSIQNSLPPAASNTFAANVNGGAVSIRNGAQPSASNTVNANPFGASVMAANGPAISAITPAQARRGLSTTITIAGTMLTGATTLSFIDLTSQALDTTIAASNINVNSAGTSLTVTLTVSGAAALGWRVVVVRASGLATQIQDIGANTVEIVP